MNNFFRALIAGWGAKKLGGGCFSTIIIFVIIYTLLGKCGNGNQPTRANNAMNKAVPVATARPVCQTVSADRLALNR
jgi:hypothetical protein